MVRVSIEGDDEPQEPEVGTISEVVADLADRDTLTTLAAALGSRRTGRCTWKATGPFTLFAPSDSAFSALLEALELNDLDAVITELTR